MTFWRACELLDRCTVNSLLLCIRTEAVAHSLLCLAKRNQKSCAWARTAVSGHALTYLEFLASHGPVIWVSHSLYQHGPIIYSHVARAISVLQHNGLIHRVTCRVFGDALCRVCFLVGCDGEKQLLPFSRASKLPRWKPAAPRATLRAPEQQVTLRMTGCSCPQSLRRLRTCTRPQMSTRWRTEANLNQSWSQLGTASNMVCWLFCIFFSVSIRASLTFYLFRHVKLVCPLFMF